MSVDDGERTLVYQKLVRAVEIVACADCYRDPETRLRREKDFRPEGATEVNA